MSAHDPPAMATQDLVCALCRKRTPEKLCHTCSVPLHLSCAQHVAVRDCGLDLGFPLPTVFCSNRCYESDFLGAGGAAGLDSNAGDATGTARWTPLVPNDITAALTLKIGDVSRTSRKHLTIITFRFLLSEGFEVFKAKVNSRVTKELQACTVEQYIREDDSIYIRPGAHSKQAELVELSERNFETRIRKTFRNYLKRKAIQAAAASGPDAMRQEQFECDILIYVKKESTILARSNTSARGSASRLLSSSLPRRSSNSGGNSNRSLPSYVPSQSFQQLVHDVDSTGDSASVEHDGTVGHKRRLSETQDREHQDAAASDAGDGFKSIRMMLNGSVVAVKVNVADLLAALGIPAPPPVDSTGSLPADGVV